MRRHVASTIALAAVVGISGANGAAAVCPEPQLPVHAVAYGSGDVPGEGGPTLGQRLAAGPPILDTDGDGVPDGVEIDGDVIRLMRGTGVLELTAAFSAAPRSLGDLDGDGRSDVAVVVEGTTIIVLGSTPDGPHDVRAAGVEAWSGQQPGPWVGDQDGDGIDDVAVVGPGDPIGLVEVVSGTDLVAAGPGGRTEGRIEPVMTLDADLHGIADLGQPAPTLLTYRWSKDASGEGMVGEVTVHLPDPVRLRTGDVAAPAPDPFSLAGDRPGMVTAWTTASGGRAIVLQRADRGGGTLHVWDLDAPCAGPSTTTPASTSAPSEPAPAASVARATRSEPLADGGGGVTPVVVLGAGAAFAVGAVLVRGIRSTRGG